jgi:hypothetical protein
VQKLSAFWYLIIETAKANKQEPHKFLLHLLKNLTIVNKKSNQDYGYLEQIVYR